METNISDQIQQMTRIQLKQDDFIGKGAYANAYRYKIHNTVLAVKCFKDQSKAQEENVILEKIQSLVPDCPGIIQYYGIQKLDIEIIGEFSGSYSGYAIFFEACLLDFQKMLGIVKKLQTMEIFNLQAFAIQLIRFFNQPIHINIQQHISYFTSDILNNPLYSTMILALFGEQSIQLSRIHAQFNIQPYEFSKRAFHQDCDNQGSTLVIMHSNEEPNSFFGGMAVPSWYSDGDYIADPAGECSWLFKIEAEEKMIHLHQWKCIEKDRAIVGLSVCGPFFGPITGARTGFIGIAAAFAAAFGAATSKLPSNNESYEKVNLNDKTTGLLFQLKNKIKCPQKVQRTIMNEKEVLFDLDSCEVFAIKK